MNCGDGTKDRCVCCKPKIAEGPWPIRRTSVGYRRSIASHQARGGGEAEATCGVGGVQSRGARASAHRAPERSHDFASYGAMDRAWELVGPLGGNARPGETNDTRVGYEHA
jgi:hypothetical protein